MWFRVKGEGVRVWALGLLILPQMTLRRFLLKVPSSRGPQAGHDADTYPSPAHALDWKLGLCGLRQRRSQRAVVWQLGLILYRLVEISAGRSAQPPGGAWSPYTSTCLARRALRGTRRDFRPRVLFHALPIIARRV